MQLSIFVGERATFHLSPFLVHYRYSTVFFGGGRADQVLLEIICDIVVQKFETQNTKHYLFIRSGSRFVTWLIDWIVSGSTVRINTRGSFCTSANIATRNSTRRYPFNDYTQ